MATSISLRVPWHDNGWDGKVCQNAGHNNACKILSRIAERREGNSACEEHCGKAAADWSDGFVPPCLRESGFFLSAEKYIHEAIHPFTNNEHFAHIMPTKMELPPNSLIGIPYAWFFRPEYEIPNSPHQKYYIPYDEKIELENFSNFISNGHNQKNVLDFFWRDIEPGNSLVIAYAKAISLTDSTNRIIVAISPLRDLGKLTEYDYSEKPDGNEKFTAWAWERSVGHMLAEKKPSGFVVPFKQIQDYVKKHPETNIDDLLLFAPPEYRRDFSYGCEHISPDALILSLNRALECLELWKDLKFKPENGLSWQEQIKWCENELKKAWQERGPFPGLPALLSALGLPYAYDVLKALNKKFSGTELWNKLPKIFASKKSLISYLPAYLKAELEKLKSSDLEIIQDMLANSEQFLKLLARIDLTPLQADLILNSRDQTDFVTNMISRLSELPKWSFEELSKKVLENPYVLYEQTRLLPQDYIIGINQLDLAFFPPEEFTKAWFDEKDASIDEGSDKRRVRALITSFLENQADKGHTFAPLRKAIEYCAKFRKDLPGMKLDEVSIRSRSLEINKKFYAPLFVEQELSIISDEGEEKQPILKLARLEQVDVELRAEVDRRLKMQPLKISETDWNAIYNDIFEKPKNKKELRSRTEQINAIEKMVVSPLSILTGGAGTGKTTALRILCHNENIQKGGILILTPTGKARVVLSSELQKDGIKHEAHTIFAFLQKMGAADPFSYRYYAPRKKTEPPFPATVIIDESSMLTEEMMGALLKSIAPAKRIIFAGDPNQLPPIGAGKPFFELYEKLEPKSEKLEAEKKDVYFSCLQVKNRNISDVGDIFKRDGKSLDSDDIRAMLNNPDSTFKIIPCANPDEIETKVKEALTEVFDCLEGRYEDKEESEKILGNDDVKKSLQKVLDVLGRNPNERLRFDLSLGGELSANSHYVNFNEPVGVENWQILSPWVQHAFYGTKHLNSIIHSQYAIDEKRDENIRKKRTKQTLSNENILYGEKVINLINKKWKDKDIYNPGNKELSNCQKYTANGEIGIVAQLYTPTGKKKNINHQVHFASQPGYLYKYPSKAGSDEGEPDLSLAYALTVHKAQGSGFIYTILVLMDEGDRPSPFLTREMLYTAMTRQKQKLIVITNRKPEDLLEYSKFSELENRLTNLFATRILLKEDGGWHDERLIHRAKDGQKLRSKSELAIYQELLNAGLNPIYEARLEWDDGQALPDFTLERRNGPIYWEHLGMLSNEGYAAHWQNKKALYAKHGISEEAGNLIITEDHKYTGALDMKKIKEIIEEIKQYN